MSTDQDVILDEATIIALQAESDRLSVQRDTADARIREICRLLVASGEARLRTQQARSTGTQAGA